VTSRTGSSTPVLLSQLGQGAAGVVWRADLGGHEVAVKVLTSTLARQPLRREAFLREVTAVARLRHPALVEVYEYGIRDDGSPWMAMELASGGTLRDRAPVDFTELRGVLQVLLDALAHAHAHDLVHRDLKPANVLICGPTDARPGLKLADFGIAQAIGGGDRLGRTGTPRYMSPEQFRGHWRMAGPWSDLYALGCMAFELAGEAAPFRGTSAELAAAHLSAPPPRLRPRFPVPDGFEAWLGRLLQKEPRHRYANAADAAAGLQSLGTVHGTGASPWPDLAPTLTHLGTAIDLPEFVFVGSPDGAPEPVEIALAPLPNEPPAALHHEPRRGLGLGLAGLREVPLIGRTEELDALWGVLRGAVADHETRSVLLRGPAEVGKTRLAETILRRARETGCVGLRVVSGAPDPILEALRQALRCEGLEGDALAAHLVARTGSSALASTLSSTDAGFAEIWGALKNWAGPRPLVLVLDDVVTDPEAVEMIGIAGGHPALFLLTARDEELAENEVLSKRIQSLGPEVMMVGPLAEGHWAPLADAMLGMSHALAGRLAVRAGGNPGLAARLVSDLVGRGAFRVSDVGLELDPDADLALPADAVTHWKSRVRVFLDANPRFVTGLELAAALAPSVDRDVWHGLAGAPQDELEDQLLRRALIRATPTGFSFAHVALVDAIASLAGPRWATHHARCAAVATDIEAHARHKMVAGDFAGAIDPLLDAAHRRHLRGQFRRARDLYALWGEAMVSAGVPSRDRRWAAGWNKEAITWRFLGDFDRCRALGEQVQAYGEAFDSPGARGNGLICRGIAYISSNRIAEALPLFDEAVAVTSGLPEYARALIVRGGAHVQAKNPDAAEADLREALTCELTHYHKSEVWRMLGGVAFRRGDLDGYEEALKEARSVNEAAGDRWGMAHVTADLGVLAHVRGDFGLAEVLYLEAIDRWREFGGDEAVISQSNVSILYALTGRYREALNGALRVEDRATKLKRHRLLGMAHSVQLASAAGLADAESFDAALARTRRLEDPVVEDDMPQLADLAAKNWRDAGDLERARQAEAQGSAWRLLS